MTRKKVLVFGSTGLLGSTLCKRLGTAGHDVVGFSRRKDHPCDNEREIDTAFEAAMAATAPDVVINLIAATNVDDCEKNMRQAALLNCYVPQTIGRLVRVLQNQRPVHFIQISSDQVYNGSGPHHENITDPVNVYALTKLVGEYPALECGGCVLRTNFFGKSLATTRKSFTDWLADCALKGEPIQVFEDVLFSPLSITTLCQAILLAIDARLDGLFNLGSLSQGISKAEMASLFLKRIGQSSLQLNYVSVNSKSLLAKRPKDMRMDSSLFAHATTFRIPTIEEEIENEVIHYF